MTFDYSNEEINLKQIIIPDDIMIIDDYSFYKHVDITSVVIPNSVREIDNYAFSHCYNLISITIPNSITKINLAVLIMKNIKQI